MSQDEPDKFQEEDLPQSKGVPEWHLAVIEARIAEADANPDSFSPAPEVIERIRKQLRR